MRHSGASAAGTRRRRAALEAGFKREKAAIREHLVAVMEIGLSEADEPFLETCLDDRAAGVRIAARNRLLRLRGSRLSSRMAAHLGDGRLSARDLVSGIGGAVVKDPVQDAIVWREYLETVVKERTEWRDFYKAARESA